MGKKRISKNKIYIADTESRNIEGMRKMGDSRTSVYLWAIKEMGSNDSIIGYSMESFIDWILKNEQTCIIFFHNLVWDISFIIDYFLHNETGKAGHKPRFVFNQLKLGDNQITVFESPTGANVWNAEWNIRKKVNGQNVRFNVKFKCSANLLNSSIKNIGKSLGMSKGEGLDYGTTKIFNDSNISKEERDYVIGDIDIADKALCNFENFLNSVQDSLKIPIDNRVNIYNNDTISAVSFKILKRSIFNKYKNKDKDKIYSKLKIPYKEYKHAYNWYQGGLTQFNPNYQKGNLTGEFVYYDVNSMYPAQMVGLLPYGNLLSKKPKGEHIKVYEVCFYSFKPKKGCEHLSLIKNKKTIWNDTYNKSTKSIDSTQDSRYLCKSDKQGFLHVFEEEWEQLQRIYDFNICEITTSYLKVAPYAKDYIEMIYKEKVIGDKTKNDPYKNNCKLMLNTCYGKFGQRAQFEGIVFGDYKINDIIEVNGKEKVIVGECLKNKYQYTDMGKWKFIDTKIKKKQYNAWVGGYITSKARAQLIKVIIDNKDIWCYCDTDSSIFDISKGKLKLDNISEDILGYWKKECPDRKFVKIQILGAKKYTLIDTKGEKKEAMSSINKLDMLTEDIRDMILNGEISEYEVQEGQRRKERIAGGSVLVDKNVTVRKGGL